LVFGKRERRANRPKQGGKPPSVLVQKVVECFAILCLGFEDATEDVERKLLLERGSPALGSGVASLKEGLDVRV